MKQWNLIKLNEGALLLHHNEDLEQYKDLPVVKDEIINEMLKEINSQVEENGEVLRNTPRNKEDVCPRPDNNIESEDKIK